MKSLTILFALSFLILTGCITKNPAHATDLTQPAYIADTAKLDKAAGYVHAAETATAPFNPYAPLTSPVAEGVIGIVAAVSIWLAKSKSATAAKHEAAAAALASVVHEANLGVNALKAASSNGSTATVAEHLDSAGSPT